MKKSLQIERCSQCYHCEEISPRQPWENTQWYCMNEQTINNAIHCNDAPLTNRLREIYTIPKWCPLQNAYTFEVHKMLEEGSKCQQCRKTLNPYEEKINVWSTSKPGVCIFLCDSCHQKTLAIKERGETP